MRALVAFLFTFFPVLVLGGEIFGTLTEGGKPIANADLKLYIAGKPEPYAARSDAQGAYRLFVPDIGNARLEVKVGESVLSADVYSANRSVRYSLAVEMQDGKKVLKRK